MTIQPLKKLADAWNVPALKSDNRDVFIQAIRDEAGKIATDEVVEARLRALERSLEYLRFSRATATLRLLLDQPGYVAEEGAFIQRVTEADKAFSEYAMSNTATRHLDPRTVDIYKSVLEVAWENKLTFDEYQLIKHLQAKLGINRRDHRVIETRAVRGAPLTAAEAEQALRDLMNSGLVCQFRHRDGVQVVSPEEIATSVRRLLKIDLQAGAYRNLASRVSMVAVRETLEQAGQPATSSKKDFLVERLIDGDVPPSALLERLPDESLAEILRDFPDEPCPRDNADMKGAFKPRS